MVYAARATWTEAQSGVWQGTVRVWQGFSVYAARAARTRPQSGLARDSKGLARFWCKWRAPRTPKPCQTLNYCALPNRFAPLSMRRAPRGQRCRAVWQGTVGVWQAFGVRGQGRRAVWQWTVRVWQCFGVRGARREGPGAGWFGRRQWRFGRVLVCAARTGSWGDLAGDSGGLGGFWCARRAGSGAGRFGGGWQGFGRVLVYAARAARARTQSGLAEYGTGLAGVWCARHAPCGQGRGMVWRGQGLAGFCVRGTRRAGGGAGRFGRGWSPWGVAGFWCARRAPHGQGRKAVWQWAVRVWKGFRVRGARRADRGAKRFGRGW